jgi:hypothetical protein
MGEKNETPELLKQISAKLDELNATINKIDEEEEKREKATRKEGNELQLEVTKIQIYTDMCHAVLSARFTFVFVVFGLIVIFYPLYIQALLAGNAFSSTGLTGLVGTLLLGAIATYYLIKYTREYNGDIKRISDMMEAVRKGDVLPPLKEMIKKI